MFSVDLSTREWDSHVVVALSEELDLVDAEAALAPQQPVLRVLVITGPRQQTGEAGASPHNRTAEPMTVKDGPALRSAARNKARRDPASVVLFPGRGDDR